VLSLPYDVRGLFNDAVLGPPDLATQAERRAAIHAGTVGLVVQGVGSEELSSDVDPSFVRRNITGLLLECVREREARPSDDPAARALATAGFVLRATPEDPDDLRDEYASTPAPVSCRFQDAQPSLVSALEARNRTCTARSLSGGASRDRRPGGRNPYGPSPLTPNP
jgi:hypothetical protein